MSLPLPDNRQGWFTALGRPFIYLPPIFGIWAMAGNSSRAAELSTFFIMFSGLILLTSALLGFFMRAREGIAAKIALGVFYLLMGPLFLPALSK